METGTDSERPSVTLSTSSGARTREDVVPVLIKFVKPVFGFNSSGINIFGGTLRRQVIMQLSCVYFRNLT